MKENAKEKFWQKVGRQNYIPVMDADKELLVKLFDIARGRKSLERFLHDNKLSLSCLANVIYGGSKRIHAKDILLIAQNLPEGCPVNKELLLAADGLYELKSSRVPFEKMEECIKKLRKVIRLLDEPEKRSNMSAKAKSKHEKKVIAKAKTHERITGMMDFKVDLDDYDGFIDNLAFYAKRKPEPVLFFLKKEQKRLFADRPFVRMLSRYRMCASAEKERRISALKEFYTSGTEPQEDNSAEAYKNILDTYIEVLMKKEEQIHE